MIEYNKYGYFIDISLGSKAAKLLRAEVDYEPTSIAFVLYVEPIFDDIFQQTINHIKHPFPSMFHFTESKWDIIEYPKYSEFSRLGLIRMVGRDIQHTENVKYFITYIEALVFLYKYIKDSSEEIRNTTIKVNDMRINVFMDYMTKHQELYPEDFV